MNDKLFNTCGELGLIIKDLKTSIKATKAKKKKIIKKERIHRRHQQCVNKRLKKQVKELEGIIKQKNSRVASLSPAMSKVASIDSSTYVPLKIQRTEITQSHKQDVFKRHKSEMKANQRKKKLDKKLPLKASNLLKYEQKVFEKDNFHRFVPKNLSKKDEADIIRSQNEIK